MFRIDQLPRGFRYVYLSRLWACSCGVTGGCLNVFFVTIRTSIKWPFFASID